jgi:4-amino-4-deoxy-L-arabinose transferase-like glycosyltransferase
MKPVRLPAAATNLLPRWGLFALCLLYILPGLIGRDPWKNDDAASFGIMWTMAHGGLHDWLWPNIVGLPMPYESPLAFWLGAICIKLFGWLLGDPMAARISSICFFLMGALSVWYTTYLLGRRSEAQPLKLAFGGQPEAKDYGRTLADGALLIYLGCLGLLVHSHSATAAALQVSMVALSMYCAARFFETRSVLSALGLGVSFALLVLARGWLVPAALWIAVLALTALQKKGGIVRLILITLPCAFFITGIWLEITQLVKPYGSTPYASWMDWNIRQLGFPSWESAKYFVKYGIWFAWPAWPFAAWAVYAWRTQRDALHVSLPLAFLIALSALALVNHYPEEAILLPLLPPFAILAAFGLPTMKRGAINAVDWFSVMTLSTCAGFIWLGWVAKQTGWPAQLAKNAFKLAPGFKPEFSMTAFVIAAVASISWIVLVQWRISRHPSVLWRAVVLSSGGVILCWLLLMTLWLPWGNYVRSYASVAQQIHQNLPASHICVDSNVGPAQRASFAYFGEITFSQFGRGQCEYYLMQDSVRNKDDTKHFKPTSQWKMLWEGRRPSDRDERFRLYQRQN